MKKWSKEKQKEYRKLKREGKTKSQLKEHFGDDIYYSGMFNKVSNILPWHLFTEIKINPVETPYSYWNRNSNFYSNKIDYLAEFVSRTTKYILYLMYYEVNKIPTYNVIFTTREQYDEYIIKFEEFIQKGYITEEEREILKDILEKETNLNDVFGLTKRLSFVIFDLYQKKINGFVLSIGETDNPTKIKFYRDVIKNSFQNIEEKEKTDNVGNKYYLYKIN